MFVRRRGGRGRRRKIVYFCCLEMDVKGGKVGDVGDEGRSVHQPQSRGDEDEREKKI